MRTITEYRDLGDERQDIKRRCLPRGGVREKMDDVILVQLGSDGVMKPD